MLEPLVDLGRDSAVPAALLLCIVPYIGSGEPQARSRADIPVGAKQKVPTQIVLVHDDPEFSRQISAALQAEGLGVTTFENPLAVLGAVDKLLSHTLLITRIEFSTGKSNGVSLARILKHKLGVKILFVSRPENQRYVDDEDEFVATPVSAGDVAQAARRLIAQLSQSALGLHNG